MRLLTALLLPICLAACDSPSLAFTGAPAARVSVGGSEFTVRRRGDQVEAVRTSREVLPSRSGTEAKARRAIEIATGCGVKEIGGDVSMQLARLDC